jgi:hypothetical protein
MNAWRSRDTVRCLLSAVLYAFDHRIIINEPVAGTDAAVLVSGATLW